MEAAGAVGEVALQPTGVSEQGSVLVSLGLLGAGGTQICWSTLARA